MNGKVENRTDRMIKIKSSIAFVKDFLLSNQNCEIIVAKEKWPETLGEICSTIADMKENFDVMMTDYETSS